MKIVFVIGSPGISGGTYVILQHAIYLKRQGHDISIMATFPFSSNDLSWHDAFKEIECVDFYQNYDKHNYDVAIATWWRTASEIHMIQAEHYIYFVQSIESKFYDENETKLINFVNSTYTLGMAVITEATWIKSYLEENYSANVRLVKNGIRKDLYQTKGETLAEKGKMPRILVEGPLGVPFKNVERTIELVSQIKGIDSVWLLTSSDIQNDIPGVDRIFSKVNIEHVPAIYRSCDILVKLSLVEGMFGPPLEMFHCGGTAIVYDVTGYDEYIKDGYNAIVVKTGNEKAVLDAIYDLINNPCKLNMLKEHAIVSAQQWPDWNDSSSQFENKIFEICSQSPLVDRERLEKENKKNFSVYAESEIKIGSNSKKYGLSREKIIFLLYPLYVRCPAFIRGIVKKMYHFLFG